jgi:hypothetical protein
MKTLELNRGFVTLLDDEDFERFNRWRWCAARSRAGKPHMYAQRDGGRPGTLYLHRLILDAPRGMQVDHINGNTLDNRRANLRLVTPSQNMQNTTRARVDSRSGVKNVIRRESGNFQVVLRLHGKPYCFGTHADLETARRVAAEARKKLHTHAPVGLL